MRLVDLFCSFDFAYILCSRSCVYIFVFLYFFFFLLHSNPKWKTILKNFATVNQDIFIIYRIHHDNSDSVQLCMYRPIVLVFLLRLTMHVQSFPAISSSPRHLSIDVSEKMFEKILICNSGH